jgi:GR25 family glycosyltransferase involved in LPS biosynthesis
MNNPFDYFDEIYCINLDERTDRWQHAQEEFKKAGISDRVQRYSAIKDKDGRIGLIKSNLDLIKKAKDKKLKNILIFEDDFEFLVDNPLQVLETSLKQAQGIDWYLFYLGANTHQKLIKFKPNLVLLKNAFATHSLAYNNKAFDHFINKYDKLAEVKNFNDILDVFCATYFQEKFICLMTNPMMTTQMNSFSDIEGKFVNYSFIEERYKKNIQ